MFFVVLSWLYGHGFIVQALRLYRSCINCGQEDARERESERESQRSQIKDVFARAN
jgi:hypothetical protein